MRLPSIPRFASYIGFGLLGFTVMAWGAEVVPAAPPSSFFSDLLKAYQPRELCMFYEPVVIWLHLISDALIALAYYSIPVALIYFARRRSDLTFSWMFVCFAVFILACGTTHVMNIVAL